MRRAEYSQAQSVLRRSLGIAERIGDIPVKSFALGNLGISDIRTGNLLEAEAELSNSIILAERIDDRASVSLWCTYRAYAMQELGMLSDAQLTLHRALATARAIHLTPYVGLALVAIGNVRIAQAIFIDNNQNKEALRRAKATLARAIALEGIEAETRTEGQLILAHVALISGDLVSALRQALQALDDAHKFELMWLVARAQQLLGCIEAGKEQWEQATQYFEQALRIFRKSDMNLETARTLRLYGMMLVKQDNSVGRVYSQGLEYLREALRTFIECKADLDRKMVERFLAEHDVSIAK